MVNIITLTGEKKMYSRASQHFKPFYFHQHGYTLLWYNPTYTSAQPILSKIDDPQMFVASSLLKVM